jgi:hypothetical protein
MKLSESPIFWLLGILLTGFVGTWFRGRENKKAQKVKDLRSKIDAVSKDVDDIEELAYKYFLKNGSDPESAGEGFMIKARLKRVGTTVNIISKDSSLITPPGAPSGLTKLMKFRQSITLVDFDAADRRAALPNDVRFNSIASSAAELKSVLEDLYNANQ